MCPLDIQLGAPVFSWNQRLPCVGMVDWPQTWYIEIPYISESVKITMVRPRYRNTFHITEPLWQESTTIHRRRNPPFTWWFHPFYDLSVISVNKLSRKQSSCRRFEIVIPRYIPRNNWDQFKQEFISHKLTCNWQMYLNNSSNAT